MHHAILLLEVWLSTCRVHCTQLRGGIAYLILLLFILLHIITILYIITVLKYLLVDGIVYY